MSARIVPLAVIDDVELYVEKQLSDAAQYENRELFDSSGVWSLHALAAAIYRAGWQDGERTESRRADGQRRRDRDHSRASA